MFSRFPSSRCQQARPLLSLTIMKLVIVTFFSSSVLTLLKPPSSASSTQTHEDTAPTARPSDTKSQPSDRPPLPDTQPEKIPDAASPSQDVPSLKRWLQTRFKKGSTLQEPDRHFRKSSTMASGQRQKVGSFFFDIRTWLRRVECLILANGHKVPVETEGWLLLYVCIQ